MKACFLLVTILLACNVFSQNTTSWKTHIIDNIVTLNVPGDLEVLHPMERFTVYRWESERISFLFTKVDGIETASLADDSADLRDKYKHLLQAFIITSSSKLIDSGLFKQENFMGSYLKGRMNKHGIDCYLEYKAFFLNEDTYGIQIIYPITLEYTLTDMRNKLLNAMIISPTAKQCQTSIK